jgi:hypothetical protein
LSAAGSSTGAASSSGSSTGAVSDSGTAVASSSSAPQATKSRLMMIDRITNNQNLFLFVLNFLPFNLHPGYLDRSDSSFIQKFIECITS